MKQARFASLKERRVRLLFPYLERKLSKRRRSSRRIRLDGIRDRQACRTFRASLSPNNKIKLSV